MGYTTERRVVLRKIEGNTTHNRFLQGAIKEEKYITGYELGTILKSTNELTATTARTTAYTLDDRIVLLFEPTINGRSFCFGIPIPFGNAKTVSEAEQRLYDKLRKEAPKLVQDEAIFHSFYDETGRGTRYNRVRIDRDKFRRR